MDLKFYSPDEQRAQRLADRLHAFARVQWVDTRSASFVPNPENIAVGLPLLLDYSPEVSAQASVLARRLMLAVPGASLVGVGATGTDQAAGVLAALRAGVSEFLDMDARDDDIAELLARVQGQQRPVAAAARPAPVMRARLVLLLGVRPGVGTSTLAAHLGVLASASQAKAAVAEAAHASAADDVMLLDLGRPAGDTSLYLGVNTEFHYEDALQSAKRIDATLIRTAFAHHPSHLTVLSQLPGTLENPSESAELATLLHRLRENFDLVLTDLGGLPVSGVPLPLLREADEVWLVSDTSIGAMVSLDACLHVLDRLSLRDARFKLLVNRHDDSDGLTPQQIAERFELELAGVLPERTRAIRASASQGQLLHRTAPRDPYVRALAALLEKLRKGTSPVAESAGWTRLLQGLGGTLWKK